MITITDILSMSLSELEARLKDMGEPKFRASQIYECMEGCVELWKEI